MPVGRSDNKKVTTDVNIIGGSIAGLLAGSELACQGLDVTIYEEHREIGVPEKCDGLVSSAGMDRLGLVLPSSVVQNSLTKAVFFSPSLKEISIDAQKQNVIVIDRSRFDKFIAERAASVGAKIRVGQRVSQYAQSESSVSMKVDGQTLTSKILLDCGGYEPYISAGGKTLQGGQYLVFGEWFESHTVEVYIDPLLYPGFFKWVIPISKDMAKIGVAGGGINTFQVLDNFAEEKNAQVIRKMAAPVLCMGALKSFVSGRVARAGDAAGQAKPTTGGGIFTGGYGGVLAGRAAAKAIKQNDLVLLSEYEDDWKREFGKEFGLQSKARTFFSKLTRDQVDRLFEMIASSDIPRKISDEGDFDRHSIAILKAFGLANVISTFGMFFSNELKQLISK
jgi:digeranylgeranylglycerophospholipid reductase